MKTKTILQMMPAHLLAAVLMAAGALTTAQAQTSLDARLVSRPLTPGDIANTNYMLPADLESSAGLTTVGLGTAVYLEVDVNKAIPSADITNDISWSVTGPTNSTVMLTDSPLGANVPVYGPSDQLVYQVAGRKLLRLESPGKYTVTVTLTSASEGTTNLTFHLTAGTYMGLYTCSLCHSGGTAAENKVVPWSKTLHSHMFSDGIDGLNGSSYSAHCIECHTVGYDTNTNAVDGGFDDVAATLGWTFPTNLVPGNWASMQANYPTLANLANIQCENCHGPGSQHAILVGNTNSTYWPSITVSFNSGDCAQCHDDPPHHTTVAEWDNSLHAITTRDPSGSGRDACVRCHTGKGFVQYVDGVTNNIDTAYVPINCQTCHEPHGETIPTNNPHIIRMLADVTLENGTVVTNGGEGLLCMECHHAREDAATYATSYHSYFGPHHGPQADMLEGANGFTYGEDIPSSAHRFAVTNSCVTCHMQAGDSTYHDGGHTWEMSYNGKDLVGACQQCHGSTLTDFNFPLQDYDGDGVIQGVQTEVQNLLNKLSTLLPNANGVVDGLVKNPSPTSNWTAPELEADYNYQFVANDGSLGIHNTAYAVGLLKASIANLTGDANNDGLPDAWQTNYFGTINNPDAAPDAVNNTAGVPNWMMYALGLDPRSNPVVTDSGVIYFDGNNIVNGATNSVAIYKAAEIVFNTQTGVNYQIQGISNLSGGWVDVSTNIPGTGGSVSYLTPTRDNAHMFFRVVNSSAP